MLVVFVMLHLFSGQSDPGRLPVFIDILLCFSFLSPLNLLASRCGIHILSYSLLISLSLHQLPSCVVM